MERSATQHVDPAAIERELAEIWGTINEQNEAGTVTRAAMSNVMVFCKGEEQALEAADRIPLLVRQHPARVLVLAEEEGRKDNAIHAWVTAHCRRVDRDTQLCAEHIELRFHPGSIERAASVVRTLLIGDLPSALWWLSPEPPALAGKRFDAFASMANQIIYDSIGWPDPAKGVQAMAHWSRGEHNVIFNLAWRRLKTWRRILSQSLAPSAVPGALEHITEIELHHGPHALPMAWLLVGWLASRLGWQPERGRVSESKHLTCRFRSSTGSVQVAVHRADTGPPVIERMRVGWRLGRETQSPGAGYAEYRQEGHHLRCQPGGDTIRASSIPIADQRLEQMVAAQLAHRAGDTLFEKAQSLSETMAKVIR